MRATKLVSTSVIATLFLQPSVFAANVGGERIDFEGQTEIFEEMVKLIPESTVWFWDRRSPCGRLSLFLEGILTKIKNFEDIEKPNEEKSTRFAGALVGLAAPGAICPYDHDAEVMALRVITELLKHKSKIITFKHLIDNGAIGLVYKLRYGKQGEVYADFVSALRGHSTLVSDIVLGLRLDALAPRPEISVTRLSDIIKNGEDQITALNFFALNMVDALNSGATLKEKLRATLQYTYLLTDRFWNELDDNARRLAGIEPIVIFLADTNLSTALSFPPLGSPGYAVEVEKLKPVERPKVIAIVEELSHLGLSFDDHCSETVIALKLPGLHYGEGFSIGRLFEYRRQLNEGSFVRPNELDEDTKKYWNDLEAFLFSGTISKGDSKIPQHPSLKYYLAVLERTFQPRFASGIELKYYRRIKKIAQREVRLFEEMPSGDLREMLQYWKEERKKKPLRYHKYD